MAKRAPETPTGLGGWGSPALLSLRFPLGLWVCGTVPAEPWACSGVGAFWAQLLALRLIFVIGSAIGIRPPENWGPASPSWKRGAGRPCLGARGGLSSVAAGEIAAWVSHPGGPFSTRHHGRWDAGQPGASSGASPPRCPPCRSAHRTAARRAAPSCRAAAGWRG